MNRKKIVIIVGIVLVLLCALIYLGRDTIMQSDIGIIMQDESKRMEKINGVVEVFTGQTKESPSQQ